MDGFLRCLITYFVFYTLPAHPRGIFHGFLAFSGKTSCWFLDPRQRDECGKACGDQRDGERLKLTLIPRKAGWPAARIGSTQVIPEILRLLGPGKRPPQHRGKASPDYGQTAAFSRGLALICPFARECPTVSLISCAKARSSPSSLAGGMDRHFATS